MSEYDAPSATDDAPAHFVQALRARHGSGVLAIVLYGSWLRGKRDTVLDFYVLLEDYGALGSRAAALANRLLPPNVYYLLLDRAGTTQAAKYATVSLVQFERAITRGFHPYFWARFAQPWVILYVRDAATRARLDAARVAACRHLLAAVSPTLPARFSTEELWTRAFALTYASELRSEHAARAAELARTYARHLEQATLDAAPAIGLTPAGTGRWTQAVDTRAARRAQRAWVARRLLGKLLSVLRLAKAAFTFDDPLTYILWKVERHSGVREQAGPLQRRYPLLFAWPVLWRLYRRGGFR